MTITKTTFKTLMLSAAVFLMVATSAPAFAQHDRTQSDGGYHNVSTTQPDINHARAAAAASAVSLHMDTNAGRTQAAHQDQVNIDRANARVTADLASCSRCQ